MNLARSLPLAAFAVLTCAVVSLRAHPVSFNSTITYSASQPAGAAASASNWTGAAFDAANIGGSGVNADGGANNGTANDASTYVAKDRPVQGQTFTTGSNANGYDLTGLTVRMAGYTNNTATGSNVTSWNLNAHNGPIIVTIGRISGTTRALVSMQNFTAGGTGTPGSGGSANGSGTYLTFNLPFTVHLEPNTTYGFDLVISNGSSNYFEWLGTSSDAFASGTAYHRSGNTITPLAGDRVFMANLTARSGAASVFAHPGALHTQADLARMKAKVEAGSQPWKASFDTLSNSPWAQTWWPAYDVDTINRGGSGSNNYTRSQQDAQAIYELALRWHLTGNTAYADRAVQIANVWSGLLGITGDSNASLASGICGYLFAIGGELLSAYPGWPDTEKQAYKDMMMRVFYPANFDFLWRHHGTPESKGGNTHYRLNWDTANMASMAAIGILCDNRAVYEQAVDYFKAGPGNGRVERAAWYLHPEGLAQTEESGRDQGHNLGGWYAMALLCQMAWNQGDDLFGYDNNRVLRAYEYNAKYNLGNDVPWVYHRNASLTYTETLSSAVRGPGGYPAYELVYNHYANVKGIDAPYSRLVVDTVRPEPRPDTSIHPSQVDWLGLGSLTFARDPIAAGVAPSGLVAHWSKNRVLLTWWGSAHATGYEVKRATSPAGPYTTLGSVGTRDLHFTDTTVVNGTTYSYRVTALVPSGNLDSTPLEVKQTLVNRYSFEGTTADVIGTRHATPKGGETAPGYAAGFGGGQALSLNGTDQYVQLPVGSAHYQDLTLSAWVYWNGGGAWQRVFDFGSDIDKYLMLTPKSGSNTLRFQMTTSRATDGTVTLDGPVMPTGTWTHVAVTINGDAATLYVNGVPVDSEATGSLDPLFAQPFCYLGRSMWNSDPFFSGRIDDFCIYNHALSGAQVWSLWGQGTGQPPAFSANPLTRPDATQGLNYGTHGATLAGSATNAAGGTLTYTKITGPSWLAVTAAGALSGTPGNDDVGENLFVVRVTSATGATDDANLRILVTNTNDAPAWSSATLVYPDVTRDRPYSGTLAGQATDIDAGDTVSFSKIAGPAWLTVAADGTLSGTPAGADVGLNRFTLRVTDAQGAAVDASLQVTVFGHELRVHLAFDGTTSDSVGSHPGTAAGSPVYTDGRRGQALVFDGVDDAVTLTEPLSPLVFGALTISAWVWWDGGNAWQRIFDFGTGTNQYVYLSPRSGGNTLRFSIKNGGGEQQLNTTQLATGQWMHLAVTVGGGVGRLYVNGALAASNTSMTLTPGDITATHNYLGDSQWSADPLFAGRIDDFRIYNYALDATEIAAVIGGPPAAPASLTATPNGSAAVTLSWSAVADATSYRVKRSATSGGPYSVVATGVSGTGYSDTGLAAATTYYYVVSAVSVAGESAASSAASATTAAGSGGSSGSEPVQATVALGKLAQSYDGTAKSVEVTTTPAGLSTTVTYDGGATVPVAAGSYAVVAAVSNANYTGSATGTLVIAKAPQVLSFPTPEDRLTGDAPFSLNASASSGLPVTFAITSGPATLSGSTVTLTGEAGLVSVDATQPGDANYEAAPTVTRSFAVLPAGETSVAGVYLGTFAGGSGTDGFGLLVRADGTATFAGSVAGTSLVADNLTLDASGNFAVLVKPLGEITPVTLSGQVRGGVVTGTLSRADRAFSGSRSAAAGEGAYWVSHVGTAGGDTVAIVDAEGDAYVVTTDGAQAAGATAVVDGGGNLVATLPDGSTLTLSLASGSGSLTGSGITTVLSGVPEAQRLYPRLVNASTRGLTAAGENVLITGFVVSGSTSKRVLIRVAGPSLAKFGVTSPLADPRLRLFRGGATLLDNDNWSATDAVDIASIGAFPFAGGSSDAAVIVVLEPGPYTVHALPGATSPASADGVVLTELYELRQSDEAPGARRLVNLSTRGRVTTEPLIIGFVIDGPAARRVLVRAAGPALRAHGVTTALANPRLRLFSGSNAIRENDDWSAGADATKVAAAFEATGAFAFTDGAKDAALLVSLQPGPYTAHVESVDGTSGVALVEVYELR